MEGASDGELGGGEMGWRSRDCVKRISSLHVRTQWTEIRRRGRRRGIRLLRRTAPLVNLIAAPGIVGAVILTFEFGFVAQPGRVGTTGQVESFDGQRLEVGRVQ